MVKLDHSKDIIKEFIVNSTQRFSTENEHPNSIGIYCCPWSGWITTNFNLNRSLSDTENNCPDFEFVEYDYLELQEWQNEYEKDNPVFKYDNQVKYHNHDLEDEHFNRIIFEYLKHIILEVKDKFKSDLLLQMLDSEIAEIL